MKASGKVLAYAVVLQFFAFIACADAIAAGWKPESNVEIVVSTAEGGAQDKTARAIQRILQNEGLLNVTSTVLNKPGGAGNIALAYMNQKSGDAHYLLVSSSTLLSNQILGRSTLTYTDVTPIVQLFSEYTVAAVRADAKWKTGKDLLAQLKKDPKSVSIGLTALGTAHHIGIALAAKSVGVDPRKLKIVVFRSGGQAKTALLGGHVDVVATSASNITPQVVAGTLRIVGIASPQRLGGPLASTPTWKEQGVNSVSANFRGIVGPKGLKPAQVRYWEDVFAKLVEKEEWQADLRKTLWVSQFMRSEESKKYFDEQYAEIKEILTELGLAK